MNKSVKEDITFPEDVLNEMKDIYCGISNQEYELDIGIMKLNLIAINQNSSVVGRCIKLIIRLMEVLPRSYEKNPIKERKLCSRYISTRYCKLFLTMFMHKPIAFNFIDELNEECKSNVSLTRKRPDGHIYCQTKNMETLGYVEVKMNLR